MKIKGSNARGILFRNIAFFCFLLWIAGCSVIDQQALPERDISLDSLAISVAYNRRYGTSSDELLSGIITDALGNSYISGNSSVSNNKHGFIRKYNATGGVEWHKNKSSTSVEGLSTDKDGNIYAVGSFTSGVWPSEKDYIYLEKYDPSGNSQWLRQFTVPVVRDRTHLIANGIATDGRGNNFILILFEKNYYPYQFRQVFVRKYNVSGGLVWERQVGSNSSSYRARPSLAVDVKGNSYAVINLHLSMQYNAFITQLDPQGNEGWSTSFFLTASTKLTEVNAITVDKNRHVYLTGITQGNFEGTNLGSHDAFVRKLDTSGATLWTRQFGTSASDYANSVSTDASGNIYVAGSTMGNLQGSNRGSYDAYVRKYSTNGNLLRTNQFGTPEFDIANAITVDTDASVFVGGNTYGQFAGLPKGASDVYLRKYNVFQ